MKRELFIFVLAFIFATNIANAQVVITEIMYDLEGSDTDREWVEIFNAGSSAVDLTGWKFNDGSNHVLNIPPKNGGQGSIALGSGEYAILTEDAIVFLSEYPAVTISVIDTVMSLGQQDDRSYVLQIIDNAGSVADEAVYDTAMGAKGDGNSLQKINGHWAVALPTPGAENIAGGGFGEESGTGEESSGTTSQTSQNQSASGGEWLKNTATKLSANAGENKTVLAGALVNFEAQALYPDGTSERDAIFLWSFGDGTVAKGIKVVHMYSFPGTYSVYLSVSLGEYSAGDSLTITAIQSPIEFSEIKPAIGGFLELINSSGRNIDISRFGIELGMAPFVQRFFFPVNTFIAPRAYLALGEESLGFQIPQSGDIRLLYPNEKILASSFYPLVSLGQNESLSFDNDIWVKSEATPGSVNNTRKVVVSTTATSPKAPAPIEKTIAKIPETPLPEEFTASLAGTSDSVLKTAFFKEYFWLIIGLLTGTVLGLLVIFAKRYLLPK